MPQEHFDGVSSRTYVSALERGLKDPTLGKVDSLARVLGLHPLALLALSYVERLDIGEVDALLAAVRDELSRAIQTDVLRPK